jgi:hypothetical protein
LAGAVLMLASLSILPLVPSDFLRGATVGAVATTVAAAVLWVAHETDGGRSLRDGAQAERWTATDLRWFTWWRRLHRQRWYVVHSVGFARGDVDHVLIGPGGIYAVDTKYRSDTGRPHDRRADVDRAQQQLATAARRVAALVRQHAGIDVEVGAILMTHGRGWPWHHTASSHHEADMLVLRGGQMHRWHDTLPIRVSSHRRAARSLRRWRCGEPSNSGLQSTAPSTTPCCGNRRTQR